MKLCFFNCDFPPKLGGIATFSWGLAYNLSLDKRIEEITVVSFDHEKSGVERVNSVLRVIRLPKLSVVAEAMAISKYMIWDRDYDVFHATTLFPEGCWLSLFSKYMLKRKSYITIYGTDALSTSGSHKTRIAKSLALRNATRVITLSEFIKQQVSSEYDLPANQFRVIYPGVPKIEHPAREGNIRDKHQIRKDDFVVLTICRLVERKAVDDIIRATSLIHSNEVKLLIVGDGPEKVRLMQLSKQLGVEDKVYFAGRVPSVNDYLKDSNVFILPSVFIKERGDVEGLGLVFLEAQQFGLPVIGTNSGGIPETIGRGSGFVIPERSPEALKDKIVQLMSDESLYKKMSSNAGQFVRGKFSWEKCIEEHIKLYEGVG